MKSVVGNLAYDWIAENGSAISEMRGIHNQLIYHSWVFSIMKLGFMSGFLGSDPHNRVMEIIT
jgi:hypothetical protein